MRVLRPMLQTAALAAIAALALGCSRRDTSQMSSDMRDAGHSVDQAASHVVHDPDVKRAETDLRQAGHEAGRDIRSAASDAGVAAHHMASDARQAVHQTASDHSARDERRRRDNG